MWTSLRGITASVGFPVDEGVGLVLLAEGRCRKTNCILKNKSVFSLKCPNVEGWRKKPSSDGQVYQGDSCILEGHKN